MERVHETMNAFQASFLAELEELGHDLKQQIDEEAAVVREHWRAAHERM